MGMVFGASALRWRVVTAIVVLLTAYLALWGEPRAEAQGVSPTGATATGASVTGTQQTYLFGLIGNDGTHLQEERAAGIGAKIVRLSWRDYYPQEGQKNTAYVQAKKAEIAKLREANLQVILGLNYHDVPAWVHTNYPNSYYVNQFGERYAPTGAHDLGTANLVFNPEMRRLADAYVKQVFADLGTNFYAVRVGGGRLGELTYPPASYNGRTNVYWVFDKNAAAKNPVPGWKPGDPSPNGQAQKFINWHLDSLVSFQNWQIRMVRRDGYAGRIMVLYPSWGLRPGQIDQAVSAHLSGSTSPEKNGELQRGFDFARQITALSDSKAVVTTTWIDAPAEWASPTNPTPVDYLSSLAKKHDPVLETYGENTGAGSQTNMEFSVSQMRRNGLTGMAWFNEDQLFSGNYATLADYQTQIFLAQASIQ
jgi:hypothetical protein